MYASPARPANTARFVFLDPERAADFFADWERAATDAVAILRFEAGRDPYDRGLSDLVGELSTQSDAFRTRWAAHNVRLQDTGAKHLHHPVAGELNPTYERGAHHRSRLDHRLHSRAGSRSAEALNLL